MTINATAQVTQETVVEIYMTVFKLAIGMTGILGNLLVIIVILRNKKLFQQVKSNVINQSFIDCLVSVVFIQTVIIRRTTVPYVLQTSVLFCKLVLSQVLMWGFMTSSTLNLMSISIERYLAIVHPVTYQVRFSQTKANALVALTWVLGICIQGAYIIPTTGLLRDRCLVVFFWPSRLHAAAVGLLQICISVVLPIVVHSVCYFNIVKVLRNRKINIAPADSSQNRTNTCANTGQETTLTNVDHMSSTPTPSAACSTNPIQPTSLSVKQDSDNRASRNIIKTFAIVTSSYFVCFIPHKVYIIMYMFGQISIFGHVYQATLIMMFLNCCINPIIYIAKHDAFRKGMAMLFRCQPQTG